MIPGGFASQSSRECWDILRSIFSEHHTLPPIHSVFPGRSSASLIFMVSSVLHLVSLLFAVRTYGARVLIVCVVSSNSAVFSHPSARFRVSFFSGRDKGGYYNELFLRSKRFLAHRIPRTKLKNEGARKSTSPETEPNFYLFPFLPQEVAEKSRRSLAPYSNSTSRAQVQVGPWSSFLTNNMSLEFPVQHEQPKQSILSFPPSFHNSALLSSDNPLLAAQLAYQHAMGNQRSLLQMGYPGLSSGMLDAALFPPRPNMDMTSLLGGDLAALRIAIARGQGSLGQLMLHGERLPDGNLDSKYSPM